MVATELMRPIKPPVWAEEIEKKIGIIPISRIHYVYIMVVNDVLHKAIIDTGGAFSIVHLRTAQKLRLPIQQETKHQILISSRALMLNQYGIPAGSGAQYSCSLGRG